jgi:poly(A) polymerase
MTSITYSRDQHTIRNSKIDPDALAIMDRLSEQGFKALLVGGGVRDLLLGKDPKDFDIATDATPKQVKKCFPRCHIIGRRFQLALVYLNRRKTFEVATFRKEAPSLDEQSEFDDESYENVANDTDAISDNFFGTCETDALRRDLTINALFFNHHECSIIDHVGGMQDMKNRIIKIIGDPLIRFNEDPIRMIRVIRHAARSGFSIEPDCYKCITNNKHLLKFTHSARLYEEFKKDMTSGHARKILLLLQDSQLLDSIFSPLQNTDLNENTSISKTLDWFDYHFQQRIEISISIFFAAIILLILNKPEKDKITQFDETAYGYLRVPRKIKESVEDIIHIWYRVNSEEPETKSLTRSEARNLDDTILLHKILPPTDKDKYIYKQLIELKNKSKNLLPRQKF